MVCKINFDYEVSLSDDNDSISSSEFSTDDEGLNKKFVLGDNILDVNPLKIISVRQLNNLNNDNSNESISEIQINDENHHKNVPLNNYLCYDESISNFEEESVSESELDLYSNPVALIENEFHFPNTHLKYELPIVNRFQMLPQQVIKETENINSISQYCIKEKHNRLQIEKANQTHSNKESETKLNFVQDQSTEIRSVENNVTVSNHTENNIISPEILAGLSIDVLTKFINGEKSAEEILNQINQNNIKSNTDKSSNKKRKKPKKLKRHKIEKNLNKYSEKQNPISTAITTTATIKSTDTKSIVISELSESELLTECGRLNTELISPLDLNSNETEIIHKVTLENCKVVDFDNKFHIEIMEIKIASPIIQLSSETIHVNNSINEKIFTEISNKNDQSKDCQQFFKSDQESESCLSSDQHESLGFKEELSENNQIQISIFNSPEISKDSSFQQCERGDIRDNNHNDEDNKTYENKSYQDSDECKDLRTSSTDSGFHDCDIDETNDEVQIKINKSKPPISNSNCSVIEITNEKTEDIHHNKSNTLNVRNNAQVISMHNFLDLSSFKFKFINESNLRNLDSSLKEISSENKKTLNATDNNLKSNVLNNADNKYGQKITDSSSPAFLINDQLVNEQSKQSTNTSNCTKPNFNSKSETSISYSITDISLTTNYYQIPSTKSYHPFKVDYYSPEASITNKEEMSEFLNFQWLKFCEKYTMYNHNMNML